MPAADAVAPTVTPTRERADDEITLDVGNQPQGKTTCDATPGDGTDYTGGSASKTYDDRFSRMGNNIPNLGAYNRPGWIPQGLAYWPNWNQEGDDLLLVAAYQEGKDSVIHGLDSDTGTHVGSVRVKESHLGGMAVHASSLYVSNDGGSSVRNYFLPDLGHEFMRQDGRPPEDPGRFPLVSKRGDPLKVDFGVAFLGIKGTTLYAGGYERGDFSKAIMQSYEITPVDGLKPLDAYGIPIGTQGMTVTNDGKFVFSASPTQWKKSNYEERGRLSYLYVVNKKDMEENLWMGTNVPFQKATECFRAPSMSEGMATHEDKSYLIFESGAGQYVNNPEKPDDKENPPKNEIKGIHVGLLGSGDGDGGDDDGPQGSSTTTYTGPTEADYHDAFTVSARLSSGSGPVAEADVSFSLGGGDGPQRCTATTDSSGTAKCRLTPTQRPGATSLTTRFAGSASLKPSSDTVKFTITRQETAVAYNGPKRVANGASARLSGVLTEESTDGRPVAGRPVTLALGEGGNRQPCTGTTNDDGRVSCTIKSVDQPLNADATVPVTATFDGDTYYEPSRKRTTVLLEYYTGRSYGVAADGTLAGLGLGVDPSPDTGTVRTAHASRHAPNCAAEIRVPLLRTGTLCPRVTTSLTPGTSRATSAVSDVRIGLPGLPVIEVSGATARSTSTCAAGGSARGTTDIGLRVGGKLVQVSGEPNATIDLPGAARLVVNEQRPVPGADHGRTVNAVHLTAAKGAVDVVLASATSDVHNCAG